AMPAGVSGMMQGAMPGGVPGMMQGGAMPGGMVPPGMPNPKQFIDNGMPNEDSQYGADVGG
ncbi:MAG: AIM24 family protein, partial [Pseudomonadota bacterium]|nr:AIM24 family protein [Pseudomonadota bacterium]